MFYNTEMLTKRGPLARVWMASHLSAKLSKSHLLATSIPTSVGSILGEQLVPMALRLSGQLLLGVARIYSRKAKYLLDDCNETLVKVKKAFRPGAVDMVEGEGRSREAINLRAEQGGLEDILNNDAGLNYWDLDFDAGAVAGPSKGKNANANTSTNAEISLPDNVYGGYSQFDYGDSNALDLGDFGGFDEGFELGILEDDEMMLDLLPEDGEDVIDPKDPKGKKRARSGDESEDESVEAGRDAPASVGHASARGSILGLVEKGEDELDGEGDVTMQSGTGAPFDFGGDMGGMDDADRGFQFDDFGGGDPVERPATPPMGSPELESFALTPKTAADLANAAPARSQKKGKSTKKQVVDRVTELEWESGARAAQKENLFVEPQYLPRDRIHLRLLELSNSANGVSHYIPQPTSTKGDYFNAAPPGLAPELQELFEFPSRRARIAADAGRKRETTAIDEDVEIGRFGEGGLENNDGAYEHDVFANHEFGGGEAADETLSAGGFRFDLGDDGLPTPAKMDGGDDFDLPTGRNARASQASKKQKLSNGQDPQLEDLAQFDEENFDVFHSESNGPLAVFDDPTSGFVPGSQSQSQVVAGTQRESLGETEEDHALDGNGVERIGNWSKNTVKAINVLKAELKDDEPMVFENVAKEASRRAAASFFFELLVLSTRDCIKIKQEEAFGGIEVLGKEKLYENDM